MTATDPVPRTLTEVSSDIREGRLSPVALVEQCLARIDRLNPTLHAFITVTHDVARRQADAAEAELKAERWRGPLHGVPVAVKDFYDTAGIRTTAAFQPFADRVPTEDAEIVRQLREAGAVLVGKTNMHTLGTGTTSLESAFGAVVNPWNTNHVAGGSSGGSAVALAAGLCYATVDTDAIGSGRLPAAICGVVCLKPTMGVLSTTGILAGEPVEPAILVLGHGCVSARTVEDVTLTLEALVGTVDPGHASERGGDAAVDARWRVGLVANYAGSREVRSACDEALASLAQAGIETLPIDVPFKDASFDLRTVDVHRGEINERLFANADAVALPTLTALAPTVEDARTRGPLAVSADNTFFCNYFGLPAISVPAGLDKNGVPFGIQFVGPHRSERRLLVLARAYERASAWAQARPVPPALVQESNRRRTRIARGR